MKNFLLVGIVALLSIAVMPQTIPNLPIPIGVGSAEVWGDSIYHFGGGTNWGGRTALLPFTNTMVQAGRIMLQCQIMMCGELALL